MKIFKSLDYGKRNPNTDYLVTPDIFDINFNDPKSNDKDLILDQRNNLKLVDKVNSKFCS